MYKQCCCYSLLDSIALCCAYVQSTFDIQARQVGISVCVKRFVAVTGVQPHQLVSYRYHNIIVRIRLGEVIEADKVHPSGVVLIVHRAKPNAK